MIVCVCLRVSDRDIAREAASGCASFEALQQELGVSTACGACLDCAQETFDAHAAKQSCGRRVIPMLAAGTGVVLAAA